MNEGDQKGEDEEVRGPLVLTSVEEEFQDGWIFGKNETELIEQTFTSFPSTVGVVVPNKSSATSSGASEWACGAAEAGGTG